MNLSNLSNAKVLVVGDVMLDKYWHGDTARISPEAPVPIVNVQNSEDRLGGAANVAMNICSLGASATLIGITGNDEYAIKLSSLLDETKINSNIIRNKNYKTSAKLRVVSRNQQLLRLDYENTDYEIDTSELVDACKKLMPSHDVVVISDYGKGAANQVEKIIKIARSENKIVIVDPKGNDFEKYKNASVITPNFDEFIQISGPCDNEDELEKKAIKMCLDFSLGALLVTRSEKGMSLFIKGEPTRHFPTQAKEVYDVTGAGDTVVALLAAAMSAKYEFVDAVKIANLGAGISVSKLGTVAVTVNDLDSSLKMLTSRGKSVTELNKLKQSLLESKKNNEKIVFTNGCFDLIHQGHIACLRDAKSRGDRLVVAINDDSSIKKLKGNSRPICSLQNRIAVLEELSCIDWIISFSEDTPLNLIKELKPDVYVKGGDYKKEELAEYELVNSYGGEVVITPYIKGCSTTTIIDSIQKS